MSSYDDIIKRMIETERILAPLREYERLYGHNAQQILNAQTIANDVLEQEKARKYALPEISNSYLNVINSIQPSLEQFREFERHSSAMDHLTIANSKMAEFLAKQSDIERIARLTVSIDPFWHENLKVYRQYPEEVTAELALKSHYTAVAEAAFLAQQRLLHVPWETLGSATSMAPLEFFGIKERFTTLTDMYQFLVLSYEDREHLIASFPPIVSGGPPIEILMSAKVVDILSRPVVEERYEEQNQDVETDIEDEIESDTNGLLEALNPDLRSVWLGAKEALRSENPERGRHIAVSLRELITHVLHTLAPDSDIRSWTNDSSYFDKGRPTRKSRVYYICRGINHGPFSSFVDADVRANIEFIDLFQRGTHNLNISFSDAQLRSLVIRTESLLRFLMLTCRNV